VLKARFGAAHRTRCFSEEFMRKNAYYMLSFRSTHYAMLMEARLKDAVPLSTMPTLREITQSCGISLRVEEGHLPLLFAALPKTGVPREAYTVFRVDPSGVWQVEVDDLKD
jgi:hypothetical protein